MSEDAEVERAREKVLTDPRIWTFSTGNDEDLASSPRDRNGATHNPWC
jgi:hypothetical protein